MTPWQESKFNTRLFGAAVAMFVVGLIVTLSLGACTDNMKLQSTSVDMGDWKLITHDINLDVSTHHVFASDFVSVVHAGDKEARFDNLTYELMPADEMEWWENEDHFDCEQLGENLYWVRVQGPGNSSHEVAATLTIGDARGQCGWPQFNPGPNEHGEQDE